MSASLYDAGFACCAADLERIGARKRDWGTPGAENPSKETVDHAYRTILELISCAAAFGVALPEPAVGRCANGAILFEWNFQGKAFELEALAHGDIPVVGCLLCPDEDDESSWREEDIVGPMCEHPSIVRFLSWLQNS
jgi:hypothetical protein